MFSGTVQGVQYFDNTNDSFYRMFVLLTTANFPDIMLPAYGMNPFYCVPFIFFLFTTMFLLQNFLLAIIYSKFKDRLEDKLESKKDERQSFLMDEFKKYTNQGSNGNTLDMVGMYKYFIMIHSIVHNSYQDQNFDDIDKILFTP